MTIDLSAMKRNFQALGQTPIIPMLKANGHGTDGVALARFFAGEGVPFLGLSHLSEAAELRAAGITHPIFLLSFLPSDAAEVVRLQVTPVVDTLEKVRALQRVKAGYPMHLHIETGMHRFGCPHEEAPLLMRQIQNLEGVMTHFSTPDDRAYTEMQIARFRPFAGQAKWTHAASSFALEYDLPFCNLARVGYALFSPEPVVTLTTTVMGIKRIRKGEAVGYGQSYVATRDVERIGILSFGYHDGWHLSYSGKGQVWIKGQLAPMVGKICMDFQMVDLTDVEGVEVGDQIELFGPHLPLGEVAKTFDVNPRLLLASMGQRIQREITHEPVLQRAL